MPFVRPNGRRTLPASRCPGEPHPPGRCAPGTGCPPDAESPRAWAIARPEPALFQCRMCQMNHAASKLLIHPNKKISLEDIDPDDTHGVRKAQGNALLSKNVERLSVLQYLLYAEGRRSVLVVLQGIDAGGKDGTIRHVMSGLNPQGVRVTSFKVPEGAEKRHDYLWRVHNAVP